MPLKLLPIIFHLGALDGSAGIAVSDDAFIGASDEINLIQLHRTMDHHLAVPLLDLNSEKKWFAAKEDKDAPGTFHEADIESAAKLGDLVYWIGSHACGPLKIGDGGKPKPPKPKPERQVFFATQLVGGGLDTKPVPVGKVYRGLLEDITSAPALAVFDLAKSSTITPKAEGGLNIESLCASRDGTELLIGFRNPIPHGKALLVPLKNPAALIDEHSTARAEIGAPILLDLQGRGFRDMVWWHDAYYLIAGCFAEHMEDASVPKPKLFRWSGNPNDTPEMLDLNLDSLNPEGLVVFSDQRLLIISDDGAWVDASGVSQKKQLDQHTKQLSELGFRSVWVERDD